MSSSQISLKHVQGAILRFMAGHELPAATRTDNEGQFTGVLTLALFNATGCQPRTIPPGRPQSNGLTGKFNHLLALTRRGHRDQLLTAVVALNSQPVPELGHTPKSCAAYCARSKADGNMPTCVRPFTRTSEYNT